MTTEHANAPAADALLDEKLAGDAETYASWCEEESQQEKDRGNCSSSAHLACMAHTIRRLAGAALRASSAPAQEALPVVWRIRWTHGEQMGPWAYREQRPEPHPIAVGEFELQALYAGLPPPQCAGDPGECAFNGACMYACGRGSPPSAPTEMLLYEHEDGRHAVAPAGSALTAGEPKWHRVGPVEVHAQLPSAPAERDLLAAVNAWVRGAPDYRERHRRAAAVSDALSTAPSAPAVPRQVIDSITAYGDARADGGDSAAALAQAITAIRAQAPEPKAAQSVDALRELLGRLNACIEDPMWADHAEISKATLHQAVEAVTMVAAQGPASNHMLDTVAQALDHIGVECTDKDYVLWKLGECHLDGQASGATMEPEHLHLWKHGLSEHPADPGPPPMAPVIRAIGEQLASHPASRSINDIEQAGEMLLQSADQIERLRTQIAQPARFAHDIDALRDEIKWAAEQMRKVSRDVPVACNMNAEEWGNHKRFEERFVAAVDQLAQLAQTAQAAEPAIPKGYALVPIEPTKEMIKAGSLRMMDWPLRGGGSLSVPQLGEDGDAVWRRMLAAAPQGGEAAEPAEALRKDAARREAFEVYCSQKGGHALRTKEHDGYPAMTRVAWKAFTAGCDWAVEPADSWLLRKLIAWADKHPLGASFAPELAAIVSAARAAIDAARQTTKGGEQA